MSDAKPPAERLAVTLRFLATNILHNLLNVMFDCFSIMFGLASGFGYYRLFYAH